MRNNKTVIAMTESDAHVVANKLLEIFLDEKGYEVTNLSACAPLEEVIKTASDLSVSSIVIGGQNGHALEDIENLKMLMDKYKIKVPVFMGGNLSVGSHKSNDIEKALKKKGVTAITHSFEELHELLEGKYHTEESIYA